MQFFGWNPLAAPAGKTLKNRKKLRGGDGAGRAAYPRLRGRFWASPETVPEGSDGPDGSTAEISGVTITSGVSAGDDTTSTLMWEDPETGTAFCLRGELEKSDLLRMAESVERKTRP